MNLRLSFSWVGLVIFVLPMLINIVYAIFPPVGVTGTDRQAAIPRLLEITEQASRIAYLLAITFLVSRDRPAVRSVWFFAAVVFLVLYYAVWIRYFAGGRDVALLERSFLAVPIPLAVFPVLYFLCAAIWMHNIPAAVVMVIFGASHIAVSVRSFNS